MMLADTSKKDTYLLGDVQRHMLREQQKDDGRNPGVIHPSEMAKSDWCPLSTYRRILWHREGKEIPQSAEIAFGLENVFDEGHDIHNKWHTRLWKMGVLRGIWRCLHCNMHWEATSPKKCGRPTCGSKAITYVEVPIFGDEWLIGGHADGEYDNHKKAGGMPLIEIKSVGLGTLRFEEPSLLQKYSHKCDDLGKSIYDLEGLWSDIRRPFPSHLRQGNIYLHCNGNDRMVYIYEFKANQQVKEFVVKANPKVVEPLIDICLDIKFALESGGTPPPCPHGGCAECKAYETENEHGSETNEELGAGEGEGVPPREDDPGEGAARAPRKARRRRVARTPREPDGSGGPGTDGTLQGSGGLGGLLERAAGPRGD